MTSSSSFLLNGSNRSPATVVLAHGAGAPMDSGFMNYMALGLAAEKLKVVRFEFPYMSEQRQGHPKRPPNPTPILISHWKSVIEKLSTEKNLFIGGKSLGGRIASMVADEAPVKGLIILGYPFHPLSKPKKTRTAHLKNLETPTLILQGERDTLGNRTDVGEYSLSSAIRIRWLPDGDHSFKPRKKSGYTDETNHHTAVHEIAAFVRETLASTKP